MKNIRPVLRNNVILIKSAVVLLLIFVLINCSQKKTHEKYNPPIAKKIPEKITTHGHTRIDNYYWLGERDNSEVIEYLKAENNYTEKVMVHTETLQEALFKEISGRINASSLSLPRREGDYWYYYRWEEGKEYPIYARKHASLEADEEILIDVNEIAEGHRYTRVSYPAISHDQNLMAFGTYTDDLPAIIRFKDLDADEFLDDVIGPATVNMTWANDNRTLFYAKVYRVGRGPQQIFRHVLGTDPDLDELVHEETKFRCLVHKIGRYIAIESFGRTYQEWRYLDADRPDGKFELFTPGEPGHEYRFKPVGDYFYINTRVGHWEEVIPHRADVMLQDFRVFRNHLTVAERKGGLVQVQICSVSGESEHYLDFGEPVYGAYIIGGESDSNILRYHYTSFTTPSSVYDYNMDTREKELVWREEVLGGFDPADYVSERLYAPARDGIRVPVSLVYRKEIEQDGMNPLLMYAYASSGSVDAEFNSSLLSLIDRGFVYAIAHVRGGDEMGRQWFVDGSLLNKMNTFTDFIDVAKFLIDRDYTNRDKLFAHGLSSGGLLMGGIANMQPDLFKGIIAQVPWVDVLAGPHGSLGNPNEEKYYWYMLSYSPYDNVEAQGYPNMLVTAGFYDKMVPYSQPAKWVAKLRALKTDDNVLILKTNMEAGHGGPTGRQESWKEIAFMYAFLLDLVGINE
jgi:oligopeptidase B